MNLRKVLSTFGLLAAGAPLALTTVACGNVQEEKEFTLEIFKTNMEKYSKDKKIEITLPLGKTAKDAINALTSKIINLFETDKIKGFDAKKYTLEFTSLPSEEQLRDGIELWQAGTEENRVAPITIHIAGQEEAAATVEAYYAIHIKNEQPTQ